MFHRHTKTYDVQGHNKAVRRMIACWCIMLCAWSYMWYLDWQVALLGLVGNFYFLCGVFWFFQTYPEKRKYES